MTIAEAILGLLLPAVVAGGALVVLQRFTPGEFSSRCAAVAALVGGFMLGYALLKLDQRWIPKYNWHWLPYAVLPMLFVGPLICGAGWQRIVGAIGCFVAALAAAWLLTPTWPNLQPPRGVYLAVWTPCVFLFAMLLEPLAKRSLGAILPLVLTAALACAAVVIFQSASIKFAKVAFGGAAVMLGMTIGSIVLKDDESLRGIGPVTAVILGGALLLGRTDGFVKVPLAAFFLIPLAPLSLWLVALTPVAKLKGVKRWLALLPAPLVLLAAAVALALSVEL